MKRYFRDLLIFILALVFSTFININVDDFFIGTIYTVSGIMFSIGISILVTFNLHGLRKQSFINNIRFNINKVRNLFIYYFSLSTFSFIIERYLRKSENNIIKIYDDSDFIISLNLSFVIIIVIFYCILYFIFNFLEVQKLNNDIFDKSNENHS